METSVTQSRLIAHRGYSERFPENSLVGLKAALLSGSGCIEFDVQLSSDCVPVVIHDMSLKRTAGGEGDVNLLTSNQIKGTYIGEKGRFGEKFAREPIPALSEVLKLVKQWPGTTAFVEIKAESIAFFGIEIVARTLLSELLAYRDQCVLISFNHEILEVVKMRGQIRVGWVIPGWNDDSFRRAHKLGPDFLFVDKNIVPNRDDALWPGSWQWALYDIVDPRQALLWLKRGARFIETWDIGRLLGDQELMSFLEQIKDT
jgi:glycerophosphoryl diester phosphodiesterase